MNKANAISRVLIVLCMLVAFHSQAQRPEIKGIGKINGKVVDSVSGKPVEYASISLVKQDDNKTINGTTTDDKGFFKITDIPEGIYKLQVFFIGYRSGTKTNVVISAANPVVTLGDFQLVGKQTLLKEVTVTTEKDLIDFKIDKMIYNAEKDLTSQGGVATDILKKVPQVSVDVDGNVELQGNSNIRFLINGKPSSVFGNNLTDVLQSIPASQISSIEVITSPGAKYDAEGTGGIINIILKKNKAQGYNGNISLSGGTRLENGSINLGIRKGNFGVNAFASGNGQLTSTTLNSLNRVSNDPISGNTNILNQGGATDFNRTGFQSGFSFDWDLSKNDNFNGGVSYNYFSNSNIGSTIRQQEVQDYWTNLLSNVSNAVDANNHFHSNVYDWNLNYKRKFKKEDQELDILYSASTANNLLYYQQSQRYLSNDSVYSGSNGTNPGVDKQTNISLNYTQPIGKNVIIETGAKTVQSAILSSAEVYLRNQSTLHYDYNSKQSNSIDYQRGIYAGYLSGTFKLGFFDVKAGCRYEYTDTKANFSQGGAANITPYGMFVPSGVISHKFNKRTVIKLSYTHRIQRPDYRDLNPFVNATDPKNLSTGNPNLKPEIADNIELAFNKNFEKGANINIALFYRGNKDDIQSYTFVYPKYMIGDSTYYNVSVSTRQNIGREDNYGLNLFGSVPVTSKISLRTNISCFQRYIINTLAPNTNISGFNYRANLNATWKITELLSVEVFGNFNSPRINVQGKMPSFTTYNFAGRIQLFHKKASLAFTATNPFDKYVNQQTQLTGPNFTSVSIRELPYRSFGINFMWKFGRLEFKKEKIPEDVNLTNPQGN